MKDYTFEFGHDIDHEPDFDEIRVAPLARTLITVIPERDMYSFVRAIKMAYSRASDDHSRKRVQILTGTSNEHVIHFKLYLEFDLDGEPTIEANLIAQNFSMSENSMQLRNLPQVIALRDKGTIGDFVTLPFAGFEDLEITKRHAQSDGVVASYAFERLPSFGFAELYPDWA